MDWKMVSIEKMNRLIFRENGYFLQRILKLTGK